MTRGWEHLILAVNNINIKYFAANIGLWVRVLYGAWIFENLGLGLALSKWNFMAYRANFFFFYQFIYQ